MPVSAPIGHRILYVVRRKLQCQFETGHATDVVLASTGCGSRCGSSGSVGSLDVEPESLWSRNVVRLGYRTPADGRIAT